MNIEYSRNSSILKNDLAKKDGAKCGAGACTASATPTKIHYPSPVDMDIANPLYWLNVLD
jgi:hypothetical protein